MSKNSGSSSRGIGFCGLLAIAFIVLKLTKYIDWSWWWVLSPIWVPVTVAIVSLIGLITLKVLAEHDVNKANKSKGKKIEKRGFEARLEKIMSEREKRRKEDE